MLTEGGFYQIVTARPIGIGRAYLDIQKNDAKNFTALLISSSDG